MTLVLARHRQRPGVRFNQVAYLAERVKRGRCRSCGVKRDIDPERGIPYAQRCVRCQERERERQRQEYSVKRGLKARRRKWHVVRERNRKLKRLGLR